MIVRPLHQKISVNSTKNSASNPQRDKCAKAQVAAGMKQTYLNTFKLVITCKMTHPSMQMCLIRTRSTKTLHSHLHVI